MGHLCLDRNNSISLGSVLRPLIEAACFDKREHLGGKHVHQKMPVGDDYPKNLVR